MAATNGNRKTDGGDGATRYAGGTPQIDVRVDTADYELVATELASARKRGSAFAGSPEQEWQAWSREKRPR